MSEQDNIDLFAAWLEGELTPIQQKEFEKLCITDPDFAKRIEQANYARVLSETSANLEVPNWDRGASFQATQKQHSFALTKHRWWQWQGLPITSFTCSVIAILMVITGFNIEVSQERVSIGFGNKGVKQADVTALVETRIANYQASNQLLFAQYVEAMQSQQMLANTQLTEYLLSSSRKERREDFAELIKFVNEQRRDDQVFYARQINDLKLDINLYGSNETNSMLGPNVPISGTAINE